MTESHIQQLCAPLHALLRHELNRGNSVLAVETGWSRVDLAVHLAKPLDQTYLARAVELNPDLEIWESHDVKNPKETGVLCRGARQTLSGKTG